MRIDAVILAGGEGRRMGGPAGTADKALLPLAGRPLLSHVMDRIAPQVQAIALSANGDAARFAAFGVAVLPDAGPSCGPLSGVLAGLRWAAAGGADALLTAPVDAPFLPDDLCARLMAAGALPALARAGGRDHPTAALWPADLAHGLADALAGFLASGAKPRIRDFAAAMGAVVVDFPDAAAFANLNTPQDMALATGACAKRQSE